MELRWAEGDFWTAAVPLPRGAVYEYKYVVIDFNTKQAVMWQTGANSVLAVDMDEAQLDVHDNWCAAAGAWATDAMRHTVPLRIAGVCVYKCMPPHATRRTGAVLPGQELRCVPRLLHQMMN